MLRAYFTIQVKGYYSIANRWCGGLFTIILNSFRRFLAAHATEGASSIAYYALFSVFPLLVFLIAVATSLIADETVMTFIFDFIEQTLPLYFQDLIKGNIEQALALRGSVQIVSTIGLLWGASGVFTAITHNIDRAWHIPERRNFIFSRLVGLGMIASITTGLFVLWFLSTTLVKLLPALEIPLWNGESIHVYNSYLWSILSRFIPYFLILFAFINLYKWVPNTSVYWREAFWGAAVAGLAWELAQRGFSWYLTSGWARYQLVYGSLGAMIAFLLWLYVSGLIVLYGAHLSATIAAYTRKEDPPPQS